MRKLDLSEKSEMQENGQRSRRSTFSFFLEDLLTLETDQIRTYTNETQI